ncbi:MAG: hypothetical protein LUF30_08880 [Lachnospiraceae bacterium]|nr:hypothetical protein [Lachnospiraceae bacterium]
MQSRIQGQGTAAVFRNRNSCACAWASDDGCEGAFPPDKGSALSALMPVDFSNMNEEMVAERDFRMLQSMYPNAAKELLPYIEEACDQLEYEGSAMFDEYPDFTTIDTLQKKVIHAAERSSGDKASDDGGTGDTSSGVEAGVCVPYADLIRVLLLQEFHRRRGRYRSCQE